MARSSQSWETKSFQIQPDLTPTSSFSLPCLVALSSTFHVNHEALPYHPPSTDTCRSLCSRSPGSHPPAPHPAAPQEIVDNFQSFLAKLQSSSGGADNPSSTPKGQSAKESEKGETGGREAGNEREMIGGRLGGAGRNTARSGGPTASSGGGSAGEGSGTGGGGGGGGPGGKTSGTPVDFENFWEAPEFVWRHPEVTEREIEAVMVS